MNVSNRQILPAVTLVALILLPIVYWTTGGIRIIISLIVILFVPGYTLLAAIFPKRGAMTTSERLALSLGLSLAIVPLIGFMMHFSPWGLTIYSVLPATIIYVFATAAIAWYRDFRLPAGERLVFSIRLGLPKWCELGKIERSLSIAFGFILLILVGVVAWAAVTPDTGESYTEFYIFDTSGTTEHYPEAVAYGDPVSILANIVNREATATGYSLEIKINGVPISTQVIDKLVQDQKWQDIISFTPRDRGEEQKVELWLYREGEILPYNKDPLFFYINVS
jgi:uncharacterized membrane protein